MNKKQWRLLIELVVAVFAAIIPVAIGVMVGFWVRPGDRVTAVFGGFVGSLGSIGLVAVALSWLGEFFQASND